MLRDTQRGYGSRAGGCIRTRVESPDHVTLRVLTAGDHYTSNHTHLAQASSPFCSWLLPLVAGTMARSGKMGVRTGAGTFRRAAATAFPALRPLAPSRKALTRGRFQPLSRSERSRALALARREVLADSSRKPQASKLKTIRRFLACFDLQLVPFTVEVVQALAAALKWRGYRSADLYLYHARATAERQGAFISRATHRAMTDMLRSVRRGRGPAKRCEGLILERMPALRGSPGAWAKHGPWRPRATLTLGSWWMLREIELSNAEIRSVTINPRMRTATLTLPSSKADPEALGASITHGCCCVTASPQTDAAAQKAHSAWARCMCPYHQMLDHLHFLSLEWPTWFDDLGWPLPGHPLFPTSAGGVCSKVGVTKTIQSAATQLGQPLVDSGGITLHTGHALRVTGAQGLARAGLTEHVIALVARWGSATVLRYIRSAPLTSSFKLAAQALAGWQAQPGAPPIATTPPLAVAVARSHPPKRRRGSDSMHTDLAKRLERVELELAKLTAWRTEVATTIATSEAAPAPLPPVKAVVAQPVVGECLPYVISQYGRYHTVAVGYPENPRLWVTGCGWPFGASHDARPAGVLPPFYKAYCERCLTAEREQAKAAAQALVSEDGPAHKSSVP